MRKTPLFALLAISTASVMASAQGKADAETLFREARKLMQTGDFVHACPKFEESERLDPAPGTLVNLAECEEYVNRIVEAQEHYKLAASGFPKKDPRRDVCTQKAAALDARIAHLTLRLAPGSPDGTVVKKNDAVMASSDLGQALATNPGAVAIVVSAPQRADKSYPLTLKDGETSEVTVEAGAPAEQEGPKAEQVTVVEKPAVSTASPLRPVGITIAAVGVVGLGVGLVTGIMAIDRANTVKNHCNTTTDICDAIGYGAAQDGALFAPLSTVAVIAGGVLAAVGVVLFVVGGHSAKAHVSMGLGNLSLSGEF